MPKKDLSVIEASLWSLRRRIRQVQRWRGIWMVLATLLAGLFIVMGADAFFAPLSLTMRWVLLGLWGTAVAFIAVHHLLRPLSKKISLMQVARWLETRHPEVEERISTALHFSKNISGVSLELVKKLCAEATVDMRDFHPETEVGNRSVRRWFIPAAILFGALIMLLAIWPAQVGRLLLRSVAPLASAGNIGAVHFEMDPGDMEVLEGDDVLLKIRYEGALAEGLTLITDIGEERLTPETSEGNRHQFQYRLNEASRGFQYHARVGAHESDRHQVTVWPKPRLKNVRVSYQYPVYTSLVAREAELGTELKALVGTKITLSGSLNTPTESATFVHGQKSEILKIDPSASGGELNWGWTITAKDAGFAKLMLKHRLGEEFEGLRFTVTSEEDAIPVVTLRCPLQRTLRLRPSDQVALNYEVIEQFGLTAAELELEVDGQPQSVLTEQLPDRIPDDPRHRWLGEATVYLAEWVGRFENAKKFRLRLKLSDNRPINFSGPGIGYSEWLEVILDAKAPSLVRQELKAQQSNLQKSLEKAQRDIRQAQKKMHQVRPHLKKETLSPKAHKDLAEARKKLAAVEADLKALAERMKETVQAHRSDEVIEVTRKLTQSRGNLESAPLQDTRESRHSELDAAVREADEALAQLQKLRNDANHDRHKVDQLAKLEELAQRQENLAREAAIADDQKKWQRNQMRVRDQVRNTLKTSPKATAAALEIESERAFELAERAEELSRSQRKLPGIDTPGELRNELQKQQELIAVQARQALAQARQAEAPEANDLAEAAAKTQDAADNLNVETTKSAAESLKESGADNALVQQQAHLARSLSALEKGKPEEVFTSLQKQEAQEAQELSRAIKHSPHAEGRSGEMARAESESQLGSSQAKQAARKQAQGKSDQVAERNQQAAESFKKAAQSLQQAAQQASERANQLSQQTQADRELSLPSKPMAEAFSESSQAATMDDSRQAQPSAQAAANALRQAARQARQALAEGRKATAAKHAISAEESGESNDQVSDSPQSGIQKAEPDQGIPPELAKLGISAKEWEKIKTTIGSEPGTAATGAISSDYRGLTRKYFQQLVKER